MTADLALAVATKPVQTVLAMTKPASDMLRHLGDEALATSLPASVGVTHLLSERRHQADFGLTPTWQPR